MELSELFEQMVRESFDKLDVGYLVAVLIALGGWIQQSTQRRREERKRALDLKRAAYSETVSALYSYAVVGEDRSDSEFWSRLFRLALVAPRSVVSNVLAVSTRGRHGLSPEEKRSAIWQVLDSMRKDLGGDPVEDLFESWGRKQGQTK